MKNSQNVKYKENCKEKLTKILKIKMKGVFHSNKKKMFILNLYFSLW